MAYHRKKTWKDCKDQKILAIFKEVSEEAKRLYPSYFNINVEFYRDSLTTSLGHCSGELDENTIYSKFGWENHFQFIRWKRAAIVISKYVTKPEMIRATLVHEFGHFVTPKEKHSQYWLTRANKIGEKWGIKCNRLADTEESKAFNENIPTKQPGVGYEVVCSGCGRIVHRQKMCNIIKHPELWKCGVCGSHFKNIEK